MFKINIPFKITREFIEDVMYKAFTQGSMYWLENVEHAKETPVSYRFSKSFAYGETLIVTDINMNKHKIKLADFKKGFENYCTFRVEHKLPVYLNSEDIDSAIADDILQFIIFNQLVFG